jgi:hypothetical protein
MNLTARQLGNCLEHYLHALRSSPWTPALGTLVPMEFLLKQFHELTHTYVPDQSIIPEVDMLLRQKEQDLPKLLNSLCYSSTYGQHIFISIGQRSFLHEALRVQYNADIRKTDFLPLLRKEFREYNALIILQRTWKALIAVLQNERDSLLNTAGHIRAGQTLDVLLAISKELETLGLNGLSKRDLTELSHHRLFLGLKGAYANR